MEAYDDELGCSTSYKKWFPSIQRAGMISYGSVVDLSGVTWGVPTLVDEDLLRRTR